MDEHNGRERPIARRLPDIAARPCEARSVTSHGLRREAAVMCRRSLGLVRRDERRRARIRPTCTTPCSVLRMVRRNPAATLKRCK
jgi:hypothetical protein